MWAKLVSQENRIPSSRSHKNSYALTSDEVPGMVRRYSTFSQAAQENADSRVWLGVHWRFDQTEGQALGARIADCVSNTAFQPLLETYPDFAAAYGLSANGSGDKDKDGSHSGIHGWCNELGAALHLFSGADCGGVGFAAAAIGGTVRLDAGRRHGRN